MAYRANRVQIFVPPTMPFTAKNIYDFYRLRNANGPNAMNVRQRLGVVLGLGPGATTHQIEQNPQFRQYFTRYQNLIYEGGLRYTNLRGRTHWPAGQIYTRFSTPVVESLRHRLTTIPKAIFASIPGIRRRSGFIAVGLTTPPVNASGPWRPTLPTSLAKRITNILKRLERAQVRANAPGVVAGAVNGQTRYARARVNPVWMPILGPPRFPALPPPAPRNNNNNNAAAIRPRRSTRRRT